LHRALRQQLQSLSLSGLTHIPKAGPGARIEVPERNAAVQLPPAVSEAVPPLTRAPARGPEGRPSAPKTAPLQKTFAAAAEADVPVTAGGPLTRAERQTALSVLNEQVRACTRCDQLAGTRTQTVFGVGDPEARILFIGEAPGADEDAQGEPFVGKAGQLLNKIIAASKLVREQVYICNILKCRPPDNRTPAEDECANCREYLLGQLRVIDPEYIVCLGAVAAQNLLATKFSVGKLRGRFLQYGRAKVLVTYHPSYLLRSPGAKKDVWDDMKFLMADMGIDLSAK